MVTAGCYIQVTIMYRCRSTLWQFIVTYSLSFEVVSSLLNCLETQTLLVLEFQSLSFYRTFSLNKRKSLVNRFVVLRLLINSAAGYVLLMLDD